MLSIKSHKQFTVAHMHLLEYARSGEKNADFHILRAPADPPAHPVTVIAG